jgi:hypothetical protein
VLPTQRCGRRRSRWRLHPGDFAKEPSHLRLGGSFQTLLCRYDVVAAARRMPSFDGVHLVALRPRSACNSLHSPLVFLRYTGEPHLADPSGAIVDDLDDTLLRNAARLRRG